MKIYSTEIKGEATGKHYISYSAAVLSLLEAGFELVSDINFDEKLKASFAKKNDPYFVSVGWAEEYTHAHISYIETQDEIATEAEIAAIA